jgi:hypothetical protein
MGMVVWGVTVHGQHHLWPNKRQLPVRETAEEEEEEEEEARSAVTYGDGKLEEQLHVHLCTVTHEV